MQRDAVTTACETFAAWLNQRADLFPTLPNPPGTAPVTAEGLAAGWHIMEVEEWFLFRIRSDGYTGGNGYLVNDTAVYPYSVLETLEDAVNSARAASLSR